MGEVGQGKKGFSPSPRRWIAAVPSAAIVGGFGFLPEGAFAVAAAFAVLAVGAISAHLGAWTAEVRGRALSEARKAVVIASIWSVLSPIPLALAFAALGQATWSSTLAHLAVGYAAVFPIAVALERETIPRYSDRLGDVALGLGAFLLIGFLHGLPLFGAWDLRRLADVGGWVVPPALWGSLGALAALVSMVAFAATRLQLVELSKKWSPRAWGEEAKAALDEFQAKRRRARRPRAIAADQPRLGICLSGGGIRSASVCVGLLESLDERSAGPSLLERTDVMASVSGGGFALGALLTAELDTPHAVDAEGQERLVVPPPPRGEAFWKDLRSRLRRSGDYLVRGGIGLSSETVRPLVTWAFGSAVHLAAGLSFFAAMLFLAYDEGLAPEAAREPSAAIAAPALGEMVDGPKLRVIRALLDGFLSFTEGVVPDELYVLREKPCTKAEAVRPGTPEKYAEISHRHRSCMRTKLAEDLPLVNLAGMAAAIAAGALGLFFFGWLVGTFFGAKPSAREMRESMLRGAARSGAMLAALLAVVGILRGTAYVTSLAVVAIVLRLLLSRLGKLRRTDLAALVVAAATGEFAIESYWPTLRAGINAVTNAWYAAVVHVLYVPADLARLYPEVPPTLWAAAAAMLAILFGIAIDRRYVGLHDYWKRCIRRGFLVDGAKGEPACDRSLESLARDRHHAKDDEGPIEHSDLTLRGLPLPVFVTAVHTNERRASADPLGPADGHAAEPRRSTARFDLSPDRVGSEATGWASAAEYGDDLSMATALAISGAAVNGQANESVERFLGGLISLLQFGLGVWLRNPAFAGEEVFRATPHFWTRYGALDALGRNDGSETLVLLSDGGHHDNLGLTALLHRDVDVAVIVDAAHDDQYAFEDLTRAIALARLEEGWTVQIAPDAIAAMRPDAATKLARRSVISFRMKRPGRAVDVVYVKSCVTAAAPFEVQRYREARPEFPHDPTADQMFDAAQLDAYHMLGRHLGKRASRTIERVLARRGRAGKGAPPGHG